MSDGNYLDPERHQIVGDREPRRESGSVESLSLAYPHELTPDPLLASQSDDGLHVVEYLRIIVKRRRTAIAAFLVVAASIMASTLTAVPQYEATAQVLIENQDPSIVEFKDVLGQSQRNSDYYQTQYRILQSRALAKRTIDGLKLWSDPHFNPPPDNSFSVRKTVSRPVTLVRDWMKPRAEKELPAPEETQRQAGIIDQLLASLTVTPVRGSRLVEVTFESPDPAFAATIANAVVQNYIEENLDLRFTASKEATDWLSKQLADQRQQVEASEVALQQYREQNDAVSLEDRQNIVVQKLADLNSTVTRAKTERIQKEAAYNQIKTFQNDRAALDTLPAIVSNSFIQSQKAQLADLRRQQVQKSETMLEKHPEMVKLTAAIQETEQRIQNEVNKVVQSLKNDYEQSLAQERSLVMALEQQKNDALTLGRRGIEYGALSRAASANRQVFDSLLQRMKETGVSSDLKTSNIRVVDPAEVPRRPSSPKVRTNTLLALFSGTVVALALVFLFEYMDNRIKNPDEIKKHLGLAFLGLIPDIAAGSNGQRLINGGVPQNFAESFRTLRTNLLFSTPDGGSRRLIITSTGPGEGKTMVASNLAIALASASQRVLLVDADMRRPRVHEVFEQEFAPGLSNVLVGNAKASEAVRRTNVPGLWVLPSGVVPPNPAELLGSKRFRDLLGSLEDHFDWVLIDTPPVMAVSDAPVVAHRSNVLFVVGAEMTSRAAAKRAVEQLQHARARLLGATLNRVDLEHNAYYYSQYYVREYSHYYQKEASA